LLLKQTLLLLVQALAVLMMPMTRRLRRNDGDAGDDGNPTDVGVLDDGCIFLSLLSSSEIELLSDSESSIQDLSQSLNRCRRSLSYA
jgi:hypothetical protein